MGGIVGVGQKSSMGKYLAISSYCIENTASSIEHYIIVPRGGSTFRPLIQMTKSYFLPVEMLNRLKNV